MASNAAALPPHHRAVGGSAPPRHTKYRGIVQKAFTPRIVAKQEEQIRGRIDALLDAGNDADLCLAEGVMGLFGGVATAGAWGTGSTADIAAATGWPVVPRRSRPRPGFRTAR